MTRSSGLTSGLVSAALAAVLLAATPPARAADSEIDTWVAPQGDGAVRVEGEAPVEPQGAGTIEPYDEPGREPYEYPAGPAEPETYPDGWVRGPAVAADLLLVRPAMVVGLGVGAVAFVATLPFTVPTFTTDDAAHALFDQTLSALSRPLGEF
jgi:hypothetical protein